MRSRTTESARARLALGASLTITLVIAAACGGDDLLLPSAGEPARIEIAGGNEQADTVGQALPDSLAVRVTDPAGRPVEGVAVAFDAPDGAGIAPSDTVLTGSDGRAAIYYTLPTVSGQQTIAVSAVPAVPSLPLTAVFSVSAMPDTPAGLTPAGGDKQEAEVLTTLSDSLAVTAVDRFGNGVAGVEVIWTANDGAVSPPSDTTGPDGRAATQRTLGSRPGPYRTTAAAPALENSTVTFEATGVAPPSPQLVLVTQPSITASAGIPFERQPVIQLHDAVGSPLPRADVLVTVQIADGAGSLGGTTSARSNAEGRVAFTNLSIRGRPGDRTLLFAASDFTPATSETIEVNPGPVDAGQSSASVADGTAGEPTRIIIRLRDEFGSEIEGAAGSIRVRIEGANPGDASATGGGDGNYSATYTPTRTGIDQITVQVNDTPVGGSPLSSAVAPGPAAAAATTAVVTRRLVFIFWVVDVVVAVRDSHGNLVGRGGDRVEVNDGNPQTVQDNGDGSYVSSFGTADPNRPVTITLNGAPIQGSPYTPQ